MDEKLKSENMQKKSIFLNGGGGVGEVIRVITGWSGGKGALTPLTKILVTVASILSESHYVHDNRSY